jgi:hypothetical protein
MSGQGGGGRSAGGAGAATGGGGRSPQAGSGGAAAGIGGTAAGAGGSGATTNGGASGGGESGEGGDGPGAECPPDFVTAQATTLVENWTPPSTSCAATTNSSIGSQYFDYLAWEACPGPCSEMEGCTSSYDWSDFVPGRATNGLVEAQGSFTEERRCLIRFTIEDAICDCTVTSAAEDNCSGGYTTFRAQLLPAVEGGQLSFTSQAVSFSSCIPRGGHTTIECAGDVLPDRSGVDMCLGTTASAEFLRSMAIGFCHESLNDNFGNTVAPAWRNYLAEHPVACP